MSSSSLSASAVVGNVALSTRHASHVRRPNIELTRSQRAMAFSLLISSYMALVVAIIALVTAITARTSAQRNLHQLNNKGGFQFGQRHVVQVRGVPHPLGFCVHHTVDRLRLLSDYDPMNLVQNSSAIVVRKTGLYEMIVNAGVINSTCEQMSVLQTNNNGDHIKHWIECGQNDAHLLSINTLCLKKDDRLLVPPLSKALLCPPHDPLRLLIKLIATIHC